MNGYLVDTNVISELTKPSPAPRVVAFLRQSKDRVFMSVLSVGEIRKGIASLPASKRRTELADWLDKEILPWFGERILPSHLASRRSGAFSQQSRTRKDALARSLMLFLRQRPRCTASSWLAETPGTTMISKSLFSIPGSLLRRTASASWSATGCGTTLWSRSCKAKPVWRNRTCRTSHFQRAS